ncbi:MAG: peptidyl-prolyl cis-trans isomerase [Deltaproteobacteria bacterium]|nr:peptidyl-prolyl cis-trans isomerase [Nannocystaceae bacterium]
MLREPLFRFALLGAVILAVDHVRGGAVEPAANFDGAPIMISERVVAGLRDDFQRRNGRAMTPAEERTEVDRYIDDEALFRAAVSLGMHEGDLIVRRRLIQRMRFLHEEMARVREPSDEELREHARQHAERFAKPVEVSFEHIFLARAHHGGGLAVDASEALAQARRGDAPRSDPFPLPLDTHAQTVVSLTRVLGPALARQVVAAEPGSWLGPLESAYGVSLVRVTDRDSGDADFAAVRAAVRDDWRAEQRSIIEAALLARLRADVTIVGVEGAGSS